jgi:preprotein translocase subunit SecG
MAAVQNYAVLVILFFSLFILIGMERRKKRNANKAKQIKRSDTQTMKG